MTQNQTSQWPSASGHDRIAMLKNRFVYGNYIDEVLLAWIGIPPNWRYYVHDHLYSVAAQVNTSSAVTERYEYDAYGNPHVLDDDFSDDSDNLPDDDNPYLFTGRRVDYLDDNNLKLQYNRNRYYDYHTGRWLTHDPLGTYIALNDPVSAVYQYADGLNLYQYARGRPNIKTDPKGLLPGADGDVGYGYTPERCQQLDEQRRVELGTGIVECTRAQAGPIARDVALCVGGCAVISAPSGETAFGSCFTACTGLSAVVELYVLSRCLEVHRFHLQSIRRSYNYCMCRADGCTAGCCIHHLNYQPPQRGLGRRMIDRLVEILPF